MDGGVFLDADGIRLAISKPQLGGVVVVSPLEYRYTGVGIGEGGGISETE
jgi:hypothetical protein